MSTGGKIPNPKRARELALIKEREVKEFQERQLALRKRQQKAEEKAQKAMEIATRYTAEARDERAVRRAREALKREIEETWKNAK
ncbi:hypothetical protein CAEBREN_18233 [Caenorhabditis brenneri]|uniref:Uncharacterized protein n=1 Tax=Caenorhabditis brenneri TaxID=135651 RepID=G0MM64_CAEBE|nr:hypothetical protein CAEBREN_18233 [Caenorhabditis brenneri]